jgi:hypothetical protein
MSHYPEIRVTDLHLALEPGVGKVPFQTEVQHLRLRLTNDVLAKMIEAALVMGRERAPVDLELRSARFVPEGAEVVVQVSKGRFLKTDVRALLGITADDGEHLRVEVKEVKGLGMLPIDAFVDPVLDKALGIASARPGIDRATGEERVLVVWPGEVLASLGVPLQFATPGAWRAHTDDGTLEVWFRTGA